MPSPPLPLENWMDLVIYCGTSVLTLPTLFEKRDL